MNLFQGSSYMVSRQGKAVSFCQEEMDSFFWSRRFRDNYELKVLRLMHPNISCPGLRYHIFPIWKRHGHGRPVEALHSISCSSATLDPEPTFQHCLIYCYKRWESPLWLPMAFIGFLNWQLAAIVSLLQGLQCCQKQVVYYPILVIIIFPYQSNTASSQNPNALSPTCTSCQLTVHESFSNCDATAEQGLYVIYLP